VGQRVNEGKRAGEVEYFTQLADKGCETAILVRKTRQTVKASFSYYSVSSCNLLKMATVTNI